MEESSLNQGFSIMGESLKGSMGALIFWILIIVGVYLLFKYKIIK
jgi:hypothetical protein